MVRRPRLSFVGARITVPVFPGVTLGQNVELQEPCIVGQPVRGELAGTRSTIVGDDCVLRAFSVLYAGSELARGVQVGHSALIREGNVLGEEATLGSLSVIEGRCVIGSRVRIHSRCFLESVTIGDGVFVGPGTTFTDDPHPPCPKWRECNQRVVIEAGAHIGGGVVVLPGITIGARALVGAGSVVTRDVEPGTVVVGNPAHVRGRIEDLECFTGLYERPYIWEEISLESRCEEGTPA